LSTIRENIACSCFSTFDSRRGVPAWIVIFWLAPAIAFAAEPVTPPLCVGSKFVATDTLSCDDESNADAKECLANLSWKPEKFTVQLEDAGPGCGDYLVRFPSPRPIGNAKNDLVSMEWFAAHDSKGAICNAKPIVVVHESARSMTVGRLIARSLGQQGFHAFLIHLPGYGARKEGGRPSSYSQILPMMKQGISDARRARDAVAALPMVDQSMIGLEGTSLGGFVTATVAGMDHGYDRVFILLAGGNIDDVIFHGAKDAAKVLDKLHAAGVTDDQIKDLAHQIEPLRLAHRINPATTWLVSGKYDTVVPPKNSLALVKAAHLASDHHIEFDADHYLGILYLPQAIGEIKKQMAARTDVHASKD
jgi:dienelactone hydrolase